VTTDTDSGSASNASEDSPSSPTPTGEEASGRVGFDADTLPDHAKLQRGHALFAAGDNRAARRVLEDISDDEPEEVVAWRDTLLESIRPDRVALAVFAISLVIALVAALLAFGRSQG